MSLKESCSGGGEVREQTGVPEKLEEYLAKVARVFDVDRLLRDDMSSDEERREIVDYYTSSGFGYKWFHSQDGSIHMALNYNGKFSEEGYRGQARIVQEKISQLQAQTVLELASGRGYNTFLLAKDNPDIRFVGIDLTPTHVAHSVDRAGGFPNARFQVGDFQQLEFPDNSFDLIFVVESLCHAPEMVRALSEAFRVIRPGGRFIVIDGFRTNQFDSLDGRLQLAATLVERSMAVNHPMRIDTWLQLTRDVGFEVLDVYDLSNAIMPNLLRLQRLARGFFKYQPLSRLIQQLMPARLVRNAIAGLLMPLTVEARAQGYWSITLAKP